MAAYLDHVERLNPNVNAIVALQDRAALLIASAPSAMRSSRAARSWGRCMAFRSP